MIIVLLEKKKLIVDLRSRSSCCLDMDGFHSHGDTPIAGWCVDKSKKKMDDFSGYPHFRKPPYGSWKFPTTRW